MSSQVFAKPERVVSLVRVTRADDARMIASALCELEVGTSCLRAFGVRPIAGLLHHGSGPGYTSLVDPNFPELLAQFATQVAFHQPRIPENEEFADHVLKLPDISGPVVVQEEL